jgi:hypothetical protein
VNRRGFFRAALGALVGAKALPAVLEAAAPVAPLLRGELGTFEGVRFVGAAAPRSVVTLGQDLIYFSPDAIYTIGPGTTRLLTHLRDDDPIECFSDDVFVEQWRDA